MRVFYLYNMNDFCSNIYHKYPYQLYSMLKDTYYTSKYDQYSAISSYDQLIEKYNKTFLNDFIFHKNKLNHYYLHKGNIHSISSRYEYSRLMVSSYSLKLKTNISYPSFFDCLNQYSEHIFVCDFENQDYFWLNKVIKREENLVKE